MVGVKELLVGGKRDPAGINCNGGEKGCAECAGVVVEANGVDALARAGAGVGAEVDQVRGGHGEGGLERRKAARPRKENDACFTPFPCHTIEGSTMGASRPTRWPAPCRPSRVAGNPSPPTGNASLIASFFPTKNRTCHVKGHASQPRDGGLRLFAGHGLSRQRRGVRVSLALVQECFAGRHSLLAMF